MNNPGNGRMVSGVIVKIQRYTELFLNRHGVGGFDDFCLPSRLFGRSAGLAPHGNDAVADGGEDLRRIFQDYLSDAVEET